MNVTLEEGQKWFIAGQNGSGKSYLANWLTPAFDRVFIYARNPTDVSLPPGYEAHWTSSARDAIRHLPGRVVWTPSWAERRNLRASSEPIFEHILLRCPAHGVVLHEVVDFLEGNTGASGGHWLVNLNTGGRGAGITVVEVSQRPMGIPVVIRSEAQHLACFTLSNPDDRILMAKMMAGTTPRGYDAIANGIPGTVPAPLPLDHSFWYRGPDLRLQLCSPISAPR